VEELNLMAQRRGQTMAQMALAWCLRTADVNSVIIGASSVNQIQENIDALKNISFTDDELWRIGELGA
jgi:L-glyceraldehyde 3-phosphate reductase